MSKLETSETHTRPRFASDTQSSLMKKRTPMKLKKSSLLMKNANESKIPQRNVVLKLNGIHKKQNNIMKQSKSMQMMIMILKQQRDRRRTLFLPGSEQTEIACQLENSLVSLRNDLIKDISHNFKTSISSPAKLATLCCEPTKVIDVFKKHVENSFTSLQDEIECTKKDDLENICFSSEDHAIIDVTVQLRSNSDEEAERSDREVEDLHCTMEFEKKSNDSPNEDCSEIETQLQDVNAAKNRRRKRKIWFNRKIRTRNEHVDVDSTCRTDLQNFRSTKPIDNPQDCTANDKLVVNNVITQKKGAFKRNIGSNQRAWRPPGILKTWTTESVTSLQSISQKSSQLTEKSTALSKNKYSSTEHVETFDNGSTRTSVSANKSKMLMKENRNPRANRIAKICDHLVEAKQQQRLQSGGTIPKKKSRTKIDTRVLDKPDKANTIQPKSKSQRYQTPFVPKKFSNNSNVKQHRTESFLTDNKRSKALEVIHTLKRIIDSAGEDENATNDNFDYEKNDNIQTSPNRDTSSRNDELHIFAKDINLDRADQSSRRSISMRTELDLPSYKKIDAEKVQDLKQNLINLGEADRSSRSSISMRTELDLPSYKKIDAEKDQDLKQNLINLGEADRSSRSSISMRTELDLPSNKKIDAEKDQDLKQNLINLGEADRSSRSSISTQTELDFPSYQRPDAENDQVLKLTRIIATQTSPSCNRNVVEIGCNTSNVVYSDMEVSCNLISFANSKTEMDRAMIEDKFKLHDLIRMESLSVEHSKINVEGEDASENKELSSSGCNETLNIEMSVKSENHDSGEIPAKTMATNDVARKSEKIMYEKACQVSLNISENSDDKIYIDIDKYQEFTKSKNHSVNSSTSVNNLSSERPQWSIFDYESSCSSEEVTEYPENDVQNEDTITSELKVEDIPSDLITTFELAAKHARNLREAVIIYQENIRLRESEKRNEETIEDDETLEFHDDRHCPESSNLFISCENEDKIKSERDTMCHNIEDFCGFSTCSLCSSSSFDFERFSRSSTDDYFATDREEENAVLPENERAIARSILNERSDLEDVKSKMRLLIHRTQELELIQSERNENESFEMEVATNKTLALPAAIKKTYLISREIQIHLIYCVVCTVIFWFLQFSFRCDSSK